LRLGITLAALLLTALLLFGRLVELRADMTAFMPPGTTPATRLLLDELQSGPAASLVLVGIEGAPAADLARLSQRLAQAARVSGLFSLVANGPSSLSEIEAFLLAHRYLLSPAVTPEAFTVERLAVAFRRLLAGLSGAGAPLIKRYGLIDPIGAFSALVEIWTPATRVEVKDGVWLDSRTDRALLILRTRASSLDIAAAERLAATLEAGFAASEPGPARLLASGPALFALDAANAIRRDVLLVSILSTLLVPGFLLWRYRSLVALGAALIPLLAGTLAATATVALAYGFVHAITLAFGMTMLGAAVDYPLHLLGHRRPDERPAATAARIGPTLLLGVGTTTLGLMAMLLSSFPGLAQLGLFSAVGLATAAMVTRFVLPSLLPPGIARAPQHLFLPRLAAGLRRYRRWLALPAVGSLLLLILLGVPEEHDLAALSPIPPDARARDESLRTALGAPDVRDLITISGPTAEAVLQGCERLEPTLDQLIAAKALAGADLPCRYLPSQRLQRARQAILPPAPDLQSRLAAAANGLPFRPEAFSTFVADVAASRTAPLLTLDAVSEPALAARLAPLLFAGAEGWHGLAVLAGLDDRPAVRGGVTAMGDPMLAYLDLKAETEAMVQGFSREALRWLGVGGVLLLAVLLAGLRSLRALLRVAVPITAALVTTLALLSLLEIRLTLFHMVALLLTVGVTIDYALFLDRPARDAEEVAASLATVLDCAATTLLTFGVLLLCRNPVLGGIGATVTLGVLTALVYVIAMSRPAAACSP
jgi:predicted exporter